MILLCYHKLLYISLRSSDVMYYRETATVPKWLLSYSTSAPLCNPTRYLVTRYLVTLYLVTCYLTIRSTCSTWYSLSWVTVCYHDLITFKVQFTLYMTIYYHLFLLYMSLAILDNIVTCYCCYRFLSWLDFSHRAILDSSAIWTMLLVLLLSRLYMTLSIISYSAI